MKRQPDVYENGKIAPFSLPENQTIQVKFPKASDIGHGKWEVWLENSLFFNDLVSQNSKYCGTKTKANKLLFTFSLCRIKRIFC